MSNFFHVPEGTKSMCLFSDNTDQPIVVYFQNKQQQSCLQNIISKENLMKSALGLAIQVTMFGASAQIFPNEYRQDLEEAFSETM